MMNDLEKDNDVAVKILLILEELLHWEKFSSFKNVKTELSEILDSNEKKIVYYLSDGKNTRKDVSQKSNVNPSSIFRYWKEWKEAAIGGSIPVNRGYRFKSYFNLADFGLLPKIPVKEKTKEK